MAEEIEKAGGQPGVGRRFRQSPFFGGIIGKFGRLEVMFETKTNYPKTASPKRLRQGLRQPPGTGSRLQNGLTEWWLIWWIWASPSAVLSRGSFATIRAQDEYYHLFH